MKYFKQEKSYTCGCACVRMAISHLGDVVPGEEELEDLLGTNDTSGTDPVRIVEFLKEQGYQVVSRHGSNVDEVESYFRDGWFVMLAISIDVPHFTVYGGHNGNHVKFHDPFFGGLHVLLRKLKSRNTTFPHLRWRVVVEEFKEPFPQYDFSGKESDRFFIAAKK